MYVARDIHRDIAISGDEVMKHTDSGSDQFRCLFCDEPLTFDPCSTGRFDSFHHQNHSEPCVAEGNISTAHRVAQEMVAKKVYNLFPHGSKIARVDLERRVGNKSDFVITDLLSDPARVAIEVIYKNTDLGLQRRLRTLFDEGYAVMLVVVTTSDLHPDRLERYLKRVGPIQVGQFDPSTMATRLGSLVRPGTIDIDAQVWDVLPQYLS